MERSTRSDDGAREVRHEDGRDWDPFVVWRRQVNDTGPAAQRLARDAASDDAWRPFNVWANHLGPDDADR